MIRPGEPNAYAAEILFYLPQADDPREGKTNHEFVLGEVRIKLTPVGDWLNVALNRIIEIGYGWYAIRLTAEQRAAAAEIAYEAVCDGAQPDRGTETIAELAGDIAEGGDGYLPFFLANADHPIEGEPIEGHEFAEGELLLRLPDAALDTASVGDVVEFGGGLYALRITADAGQTAKRGKTLIIADVPGASVFGGYRTILGTGLVSHAQPPPPAPAPAPVVHAAIDVLDPVFLALSRLPQQYRGADDIPTELLTP